MSSIWDASFDAINQPEVVRPLFTLKDLNNPEQMLAWQNTCYELEINRISKYREMCMKHLALYRGVKWYADEGAAGKSNFAEASIAGLGIQGNRVSKLVINHLYSIVRSRVSRMTQLKPEVLIDPANSEYGDRISAKLIKYWIDYLFYQNKIDRLVAGVLRAMMVYGEAYLGVFWDPNAGDLVEDWRKEAEQAARDKRPPRLPVLDDEGQTVLGQNGEPLYIEKPVHVGDVSYKILTPLNTIIESAGTFEAANFMIYEDYINVDELKSLYPEASTKLTDNGADDGLAKWRTISGVTQAPTSGKVLVRYFYHKPTEFLASGRFVMSTRDVVLENKPLPPHQQGLPIARITDVDVPNEQRGVSFFTYGKGINASINDFKSMQRRNAILMSHPRWLIPRGSLIKRDALGNDITQIEFAGPIPPKIEAPPPMSQEIVQASGLLKDDLYTVTGTSDIEMGATPSNVRSAKEMAAINEQSMTRSNEMTIKYGDFLTEVVEKSINLAAAYYEKDDQRLVPVVGRDNQYLLKDFDPSYLTKSYDVRVQLDTTGGSRQAKNEMLMELRKLDPDGQLVPNQQFLELLELSAPEKFYDAATVALKAAEAENEAILNQEEVQSPTTFEDHVTHWITHMREIQNRGFKTSTPPEVQTAMLSHIQQTELLMLKTARKNPAYSINLVKLEQFPAFFELSLPDRILLDRARSGNPLTLVEIQQLYDQGAPPPEPMAPPVGPAPPPPGGIPGPGATPPGPPGGNQGPLNRNAPLFNAITPGQPSAVKGK